MRFAPEYVRFVLNENFEDAKRLFLSPLMAVHYALLVMLRTQRILSPHDARILRDALDSISQDEVRTVAFDGTCEDLFYHVDYLLENVAAAAVTLADFGRFVQDLLLSCTAEFHYLRLRDGFVQGSSIMPQKRNPVAIEHARAITSKALGQATAVLLTVHNTPFGDIVDTEDDLQPMVFSTFRDAMRGIGLVAAAMETATFDGPCLEARAASGWITVTELADTLVREHGLSFRTAHAIAGRLVRARQADPTTRLSEVVAAASMELTGTPLHCTEEQLVEILSPRHFVEIRQTNGGPAVAETTRALEESRQALADDERWRAVRLERLAAAEACLRERSAAL